MPDEDERPETEPLSTANRWALRAHFIKPPPDDATPVERAGYGQRFYLRRAPLVVVGDAAIIFLLHGRVTGFVGAGAVLVMWANGLLAASLAVRRAERREAAKRPDFGL